MLIIKRRLGEELVLAEGIVVRPLKLRGDMVHLGITVPAVITMHQRELWRELEQSESKMHSKPSARLV